MQAWFKDWRLLRKQAICPAAEVSLWIKLHKTLSSRLRKRGGHPPETAIASSGRTFFSQTVQNQFWAAEKKVNRGTHCKFKSWNRFSRLLWVWLIQHDQEFRLLTAGLDILGTHSDTGTSWRSSNRWSTRGQARESKLKASTRLWIVSRKQELLQFSSKRDEF